MTFFQEYQFIIGLGGFIILLSSSVIKIFDYAIIKPLRTDLQAATEKLNESIILIRQDIHENNQSRKENERKLFDISDNHEKRITILENISEFREKELSKINEKIK